MTNQKPIEAEQVIFVRDSLLFVARTVKNCTENFEETTKLDPQEMEVFFTLHQYGSLTVKEIARQIKSSSLSTLTRVLDRLEEGAYIVRTLNLHDRRSFNVTLLPKGSKVVEGFLQQLEMVAFTMLESLTPTERLVMVELYSKIRANLSKKISNEVGSEESSLEDGGATQKETIVGLL